MFSRLWFRERRRGLTYAFQQVRGLAGWDGCRSGNVALPDGGYGYYRSPTSRSANLAVVAISNFEFEIGKLACRADGAVHTKYGSSSVLVTVVSSPTPVSEVKDSMPLQVCQVHGSHAILSLRGLVG